MKVLQVIPRFSPKHGGGVIVVKNISKYLSRRGYDVTILTTDYQIDAGYISELQKEGVTVVALKSLFNYCLFIPSPDIETWLKKNIQGYDLVHLHGARSYQNIHVAKYARKYGVPYIIQSHGSILCINGRETLKNAYDLMWGNKTYESASKFIALNNREKEQYLQFKIPESKIYEIPNGIDLEELVELPEVGYFRGKFKIESSENVILYLGRLHKIKGLDLLLDGFYEILKEKTDIKLVITGPDDGYQEQIQSKIHLLGIQDHVILTGPLYGKDKFGAYLDADIYILPSIYETFPNTVLEAWACGKPVIVTKGCGIADYVRRSGIVIEYNEHMLKDAVLKILCSENIRYDMSQEGLNIIKNELNMQVVACLLERLYMSVVGKVAINSPKLNKEIT